MGWTKRFKRDTIMSIKGLTAEHHKLGTLALQLFMTTTEYFQQAESGIFTP